MTFRKSNSCFCHISTQDQGSPRLADSAVPSRRSRNLWPSVTSVSQSNKDKEYLVIIRPRTTCVGPVGVWKLKRRGGGGVVFTEFWKNMVKKDRKTMLNLRRIHSIWRQIYLNGIHFIRKYSSMSKGWLIHYSFGSYDVRLGYLTSWHFMLISIDESHCYNKQTNWRRQGVLLKKKSLYLTDCLNTVITTHFLECK